MDLFVIIGTEADKCKFYEVNLHPCNQIPCMDLCIQQKYQNGSCGFTGPNLDAVCYCYNCADKTLTPLLGEPYRD
jgi:hypothetical protein